MVGERTIQTNFLQLYFSSARVDTVLFLPAVLLRTLYTVTYSPYSGTHTEKEKEKKERKKEWVQRGAIR